MKDPKKIAAGVAVTAIFVGLVWWKGMSPVDAAKTAVEIVGILLGIL